PVPATVEGGPHAVRAEARDLPHRKASTCDRLAELDLGMVPEYDIGVVPQKIGKQRMEGNPLTTVQATH
ncbi:hypothetical protein ABQE42_13590, partial [Mycolicibacterium pulveris]